jgi:hypothetical protein
MSIDLEYVDSLPAVHKCLFTKNNGHRMEASLDTDTIDRPFALLSTDFLRIDTFSSGPKITHSIELSLQANDV